MNKPVAWAYIKDGEFIDAIDDFEHTRVEGDYTIPLYTNPVKELTDEEIDQVVQNVIAEALGLSMKQEIDSDKFYRLIARAILRKAQEK